MHYSSGDLMVDKVVTYSNQIDCSASKRDIDVKNTVVDTLAMAPTSFECHICGKELKTKQTFHIHMKRHRSITKHVCKMCGASYKDLANLRQHVNIHNGVFPYKCKSCDKTFPSAKKRLAHTVSRHQPARFNCDLCKRDFKALRNFKNHMRLHENLKPFSCTQCTARFNSAEILSLHETIHSEHISKSNSTCPSESLTDSNSVKHDNIEKDAFPKDAIDTESAVPSFATSFVSSNDEVLPNDVKNNVHFLSVEEAHKVLSGISVKEMNLQYGSDCGDVATLDSGVLVSGGFQCDICLKSYTSHQNLKNHMRLHSDTKLFTCSDCGRNFNWESGLLRHRRNNCGVRFQRKLAKVDAPLSCKTCNKHFKSYKGCRLHMKRCVKKSDCGVFNSKEVESEIRCGRCETIFDSKTDLRNHKRLCSKHQTFKCSDCNKTYKSEKKLALHLKLCQKGRKHSTKDLESVVRFDAVHENADRDLGIEPSTISNHELSAKSLITCKKADVDTSTSSVDPKTKLEEDVNNELVSSHVDCHNSNIEYFCKFCDSSFVSETKLNRHVSSHKTKATFKCGKCDQRFPTKNICLSHMKRRHQLCRYSCTVCKRSFRCKRKLKNHLQTHDNRTTATNTFESGMLQEGSTPTTASFNTDQSYSKISQTSSSTTAVELFEAMQGNEQWTAEEFELEYN